MRTCISSIAAVTVAYCIWRQSSLVVWLVINLVVELLSFIFVVAFPRVRFIFIRLQTHAPGIISYQVTYNIMPVTSLSGTARIMFHPKMIRSLLVHAWRYLQTRLSTCRHAALCWLCFVVIGGHDGQTDGWKSQADFFKLNRNNFTIRKISNINLQKSNCWRSEPIDIDLSIS